VVSSGGPDLFVVCKSCHSEVSPYITECPYCGARLRKRAPKLDKEGRIAERRGRRTAKRKPPRPSLGRLRTGEIPGIRGEDHRPWATILVSVASLVLLVLGRSTLDLNPLLVSSLLGDEPYRWFTSPFVYSNTGYAFIAVGAIALFGWLVERRHGILAVILLMVLGGAGGMALADLVGNPILAIGGNGMALALLVAWAIPYVRDWRAGDELEADLLGALVFAVVIAVVPAFVPEASWLAGLGGLVAGLVVGIALDAISRRRAA
jgi:membrane associated rhomboid family serine protease